MVPNPTENAEISTILLLKMSEAYPLETEERERSYQSHRKLAEISYMYVSLVARHIVRTSVSE